MRGTTALLVFACIALCVCQRGMKRQVQWDTYTYKLEESANGMTFWTTSNTRKVQGDDTLPSDTHSGLHLEAARHEFEPFQLIIAPGSGSIKFTIDNFSSLDDTQRIEVSYLGYSGNIVEEKNVINSGDTVNQQGGDHLVFWITVYVPKTATKGEHTTTITLEKGSNSWTIPVTLRVFDFQLPDETHFKTQMNKGGMTCNENGGGPEFKTKYWFEYRLTPKGGPTCPSGFRYGITWEQTKNETNTCKKFDDELSHESSWIWTVGGLANKYVLGNGWNDIGFPSVMLGQFVDNSTPRPSSFCGASRADHYGNEPGNIIDTDTANAALFKTPYNTEWSEWLSGLEDYLKNNQFGSMIDKGYWYVMNEPCGSAEECEDHDVAGFLCNLYKRAAPDLKIAISEEPSAKIASTCWGECGYDIWIAHIGELNKGDNLEYSQYRRTKGEELWTYSLPQDADPYWNPTVVSNQGVHVRTITWTSWKIRATGYAYFDAGTWWSNNNTPNLRWDLFREAMEDYEYLWIANGGKHPEAGVASPIDRTVSSVSSSLVDWNKDADALMLLRQQVGEYIEGGMQGDAPTILVACNKQPRDTYHINFQNPSDTGLDLGQYTMNVGWPAAAFNPVEDDYGFTGPHIGKNPGRLLYNNAGVLSKPGYPDWEKTFIYDDYGRPNVFDFCVENGVYNVTVSVGFPDRKYNMMHVEVEGKEIIHGPNNGPSFKLEASTVVYLTDCCISVTFATFNEYTMLQTMSVVPVGPPGIRSPTGTEVIEPDAGDDEICKSNQIPSVIVPPTAIPSIPSSATPSATPSMNPSSNNTDSRDSNNSSGLISFFAGLCFLCLFFSMEL